MTMEQLKTKTQHFFSPLTPLWSAIVTFFKTSLGMVVGILILLCLITRIIWGYYHHKYMRWYEEFGRDMGRHEMMMQSRFGYDDSIFWNIEREAAQMRNIINNKIQMMDRSMDRMMDDSSAPMMITSEGSGVQQSIARMSIVDGKPQWYSITVQDNMIKWTLQGDISDDVRAQLNKENIAIENGSFSVAYTPELFNKIVNILDITK